MSSIDEYQCPRCYVPLAQNKMQFGIFWSCAKCGGRAVTVELLRRTFTPDSINPLWLHAIRGEGASSFACPSCHRQMIQVALADGANVNVDVCKSCHFIWFDAHELDSLTPRPAAEISREERERTAREKMKRFSETLDRHHMVTTPTTNIWMVVAELFRIL
jgi:Zn-finger nucleic acid-binding protein